MSLARNHPWSWETDGNVVICDQRGWNEGTEEQIKELMTQFQQMAGKERITASVTMLDPDIDLGPERQAVIEQNAPLYDELGVMKQALVGDGIAGLALKSLVDMPDGMEIRTFDERSAAMEWCQE